MAVLYQISVSVLRLYICPAHGALIAVAYSAQKTSVAKIRVFVSASYFIDEFAKIAGMFVESAFRFGF